MTTDQILALVESAHDSWSPPAMPRYSGASMTPVSPHKGHKRRVMRPNRTPRVDPHIDESRTRITRDERTPHPLKGVERSHPVTGAPVAASGGYAPASPVGITEDGTLAGNAHLRPVPPVKPDAREAARIARRARRAEALARGASYDPRV